IYKKWEGPMLAALTVPGKILSYSRIKDLKKEAVAAIPEQNTEERARTARAMEDLVKTLTRETILDRHERLDGRNFKQIRAITGEVWLLPRTHGSALFTRGETQALVTCTLGTSEDTQLVEWLEGESEKRFMLHYNFPPFSVGEVKFLRGPGRREIGHGALAERALLPLMPQE